MVREVVSSKSQSKDFCLQKYEVVRSISTCSQTLQSSYICSSSHSWLGKQRAITTLISLSLKLKKYMHPGNGVSGAWKLLRGKTDKVVEGRISLCSWKQLYQFNCHYFSATGVYPLIHWCICKQKVHTHKQGSNCSSGVTPRKSVTDSELCPAYTDTTSVRSNVCVTGSKSHLNSWIKLQS